MDLPPPKSFGKAGTNKPSAAEPQPQADEWMNGLLAEDGLECLTGNATQRREDAETQRRKLLNPFSATLRLCVFALK